MIGTIISIQPASSTGHAAAWDANAPNSSDDHLPEPNAETTRFVGSREPTIMGVPKSPVAGFRAKLDTMTRRGIPLLPLGPSKVARMGQGMPRTGGRPGKITAVQQFVPTPGVEQVPDWHQSMSAAPGTDYLR